MSKVRIKHSASGSERPAPVFPMCADHITPLCRKWLNTLMKHSNEGGALKIKHSNKGGALKIKHEEKL